jgi:hypothetical protein
LLLDRSPANQGNGAVFPEDGPLHLLYVVYDVDRVIVALDLPVIDGAVEETAFGNVETVELVPHAVDDHGPDLPELRDSQIKDEAPGRKSARAWYGAAAAAGLAAGTALGLVTTAWLGVPVVAAACVAAAVAYRRRAASLTDAWQRDHRVLAHEEDARVFNAARDAAEAIVRSWPQLGALAGSDDPGPVLARSLWNLSGILVARAELRDQQEELARAGTDLPAGSELARDVADRRAQVEAALAAAEDDIAVRLGAFEDLAGRCEQYIREEQAVARAREAVRRADQALGDPVPVADVTLEPGHELAERTRAVLDAYRELTGGTR